MYVAEPMFRRIFEHFCLIFVLSSLKKKQKPKESPHRLPCVCYSVVLDDMYSSRYNMYVSDKKGRTCLAGDREHFSWSEPL